MEWENVWSSGLNVEVVDAQSLFVPFSLTVVPRPALNTVLHVLRCHLMIGALDERNLLQGALVIDH